MKRVQDQNYISFLKFSVTECNRQISTPDMPGQTVCMCGGLECPVCRMTQLPPTQKIAKEARSGQDTDFITDTPCRNSEHDKPKLRLDQVSRTFASELKNLTYGDRHLEVERPMNPGVPNPDQEPIQGPEAGTMSETADRHQLFLDENKTKTSARIPSAHKRNQEGQTKTEASTVLAAPLIDLTGEDSLAMRQKLRRRIHVNLATV